jgi:ketosteroid isomerase-like protein
MTRHSTETAEPDTGPDEERAGELHRPRRVVFVVLAAVAVLAVAGVVTSARSSRRAEGGCRTALADVVRRYDAALQAHDWTAVEQLLAPDLTLHNVDYGSTQDRRGFVAWARTIGDSYPDFAVTVDDVTCRGDVATVRFHEGADDRAANGVVRARVVGRRIDEMWSNYDEFGLLHQRA